MSNHNITGTVYCGRHKAITSLSNCGRKRFNKGRRICAGHGGSYRWGIVIGTRYCEFHSKLAISQKCRIGCGASYNGRSTCVAFIYFGAKRGRSCIGWIPLSNCGASRNIGAAAGWIQGIYCVGRGLIQHTTLSNKCSQNAVVFFNYQIGAKIDAVGFLPYRSSRGWLSLSYRPSWRLKAGSSKQCRSIV